MKTPRKSAGQYNASDVPVSCSSPSVGRRASFDNDIAVAVTERGLREAGVWPSPETALDRMIAALDVIAANTNDEDTKTKAQKFSTWLRTSASTVGLGVAQAALTGQLPGQ